MRWSCRDCAGSITRNQRQRSRNKLKCIGEANTGSGCRFDGLVTLLGVCWRFTGRRLMGIAWLSYIVLNRLRKSRKSKRFVGEGNRGIYSLIKIGRAVGRAVSFWCPVYHWRRQDGQVISRDGTGHASAMATSGRWLKGLRHKAAFFCRAGAHDCNGIAISYAASNKLAPTSSMTVPDRPIWRRLW